MNDVETAALLQGGVTMDMIKELEAAGYRSMADLSNCTKPGLMRAGISEEGAHTVARLIDRMVAARASLPGSSTG